MNADTLFDYLYININMPPLEEFDPTNAAKQWVTTKNRRVRSTPKAKQQEWFHGVFSDSKKVERKTNKQPVMF